MIRILYQCTMCGHRFECNVLERDDTRERHVRGNPLRCPECHSGVVTELQKLRRVKSNR